MAISKPSLKGLQQFYDDEDDPRRLVFGPQERLVWGPQEVIRRGRTLVKLPLLGILTKCPRWFFSGFYSPLWRNWIHLLCVQIRYCGFDAFRWDLERLSMEGRWICAEIVKRRGDAYWLNFWEMHFYSPSLPWSWFEKG